MSSNKAEMKAQMELPPVLRTMPLDHPYRQAINTDIIRPVSIDQTTCKFVFSKVGILDANSQLQLAQTVVNSASPTVNTNAYLPTSTGSLAMISRAYLTIGGKMISDLRDLNHYNTYQRLQLSNEYRKGILQPKSGGMDVFQGSIGRTAFSTMGPTAKRSRGFEPPFGVIGRPSSEYGIKLNFADQQDVEDNFGIQNADATNTLEVASRRLTVDANTTPVFAVGLSQLIPFLKAQGGLQLPLGMIQEEVALVIEWASPEFGHRFCVPQTDSANQAITATDCLSTIVTDKVQLMVDYLFYPENMVNVALQMSSKGGYNVPFKEIMISEGTNTISAGDNVISFNLAFAGKRVKDIVVQKQLIEAQPADEVLNNVGRYNSLAYVNNEAYNLQINSRNFYSRRISNPATQKAEVDECSISHLMVPGARYSWNNNWNGTNKTRLITDRQYNTYNQQSEEASQHWE